MAIYLHHDVVVSGVGFPESLRWRDGTLWYADWAAGEICRLGPDRQRQVAARGVSFPLCFDLIPSPGGPQPVVALDFAGGLAFPNGMAVIDNGGTLLVAESWGNRLTAYTIAADGRLADRRVWAETPGLHPDGIDARPDGSVWFADVGMRCCLRVVEGGAILDRVNLPQSAFDCVVADLADGPTLYVAVNNFGDDAAASAAEPAGRILAVPLS